MRTVSLLVVLLVTGCYDGSGPPPCDGHAAAWPDPCAGYGDNRTEDAGRQDAYPQAPVIRQGRGAP